jgi:hypothetical protein
VLLLLEPVVQRIPIEENAASDSDHERTPLVRDQPFHGAPAEVALNGGARNGDELGLRWWRGRHDGRLGHPF